MKKKFDAVQFQRRVREKLGKAYLADPEGFVKDLQNKYGPLKSKPLKLSAAA